MSWHVTMTAGERHTDVATAHTAEDLAQILSGVLAALSLVPPREDMSLNILTWATPGDDATTKEGR